MAMIKKYIFLFLLLSATQIVAQNDNIKNLTIENGLPSNIIYDIKQDKIGYLWIATEKGVVKYDGDNFNHIHKFKTTNILIDNDVVYLGLENGLFIKEKSNEKIITSKRVFKVFSFNKDIFIGTSEGVYVLNKESLDPVKFNSNIDFSVITDIIYSNDSFYLATNKGLWKVNDLLKPTSIHKIVDKPIKNLEKFNNTIIAATSQNKLFVVKNKTVIKSIETLNNISSVNRFKNEIWVTSYTDGVEIFTLPSYTFKQKINKYNSLISNSNNSVFRDYQNSTYIASKKGIFILSKPHKVNYSSRNPTIHFENLQINYQNVDSLLVMNKRKLSATQNNIGIYFKTVNVISPKDVKYRYKLMGEFSPWSYNNNVQFPNLNSGLYNFQVQSKIGNQKSEIKTFSFTIDTPIYQQAWFLFILIITILLLGYFSLHYYIIRINKINKDKVNQLKFKNRLLSLEQKALQLQMNPHFIFNVLNGIKALGNSGNVNELNSTISKFSVLLRGILNNSRKEEITLQEEINLLKNYIELEQRMSSKEFTFQLDVNLNNIDPEEILIPTMIVQPFVENCIQHAFVSNAKGKITIHFNIEHQFLKFTIIDNGIGIHQSKKNKGNTNHNSLAIHVSKERLYAITTKSSFNISEVVKENEVKGTKVSFRIPLKTDY